MRDKDVTITGMGEGDCRGLWSGRGLNVFRVDVEGLLKI